MEPKEQFSMKAFIQPNMISWSRSRYDLTEECLAKKLHVKPEQVVAWEGGEDFPTLRQAQNLAKVLHIPLGWLYLETPPEDKAALPDLRTIRNAEHPELSPDFKEQLNEVLFKQQEYADLIIEEGAEALPFVGKFSVTDRLETVVKDIRTALGIDQDMRRNTSSWEDFLRDFIHRAESVGILVMRSGIVGNNTHRPLSVEEFRGFAISDVFAPVIFINGRDAKAAQIFTLAHELAHLWVGASGISNQAMNASGGNAQRIEVFCNRVAAELLVPAADMTRLWVQTKDAEENIHALIRHFRVSGLVMLYRAKELCCIDQATFRVLYQMEMTRHQRRPTGAGGPPPHVTIPARNSHLLTDTILAAAYEGRILFRDACRVLGAKMNTLQTLALESGVL